MRKDISQGSLLIGLKLDGNTLATASGRALSFPFPINAREKNIADGEHILVAEALNADGSVLVQSSERRFTVDTTPPQVSIRKNNPPENKIIRGLLNKSERPVVDTTDNSRVTEVTFFLDKILMQGTVEHPNRIESVWRLIKWDSCTVDNGTYSISARAKDAVGNIGISEPRTVVIGNKINRCGRNI